MQREQPNFYAIIPATVRYDTFISPNAKLLYGEITALSNREGYCWATNDYFAKLYNVSVTSISIWMALLRKRGYIQIDILKDLGNKRYISVNPIKENLNRSLRKLKEGIKENLNRGVPGNNDEDGTNPPKNDSNITFNNTNILEPLNSEAPEVISDSNTDFVNRQKYIDLTAELKRQGVRVIQGSKYVADYKKPKKKATELVGWQKVYYDIVQWYHKRYNVDVLSPEAQYRALRAIRKQYPTWDYKKFYLTVTDKLEKLNGVNGKMDFPILLSRWQTL